MVRIYVLDGNGERRVDVPLSRMVRIGRDADNDLVLVDRFVSARHGELRAQGVSARYQDLQTTNGSALRRDGVVRRIDASCGHSVELKNGDELLLGDPNRPVVMRIEVSASAGLGSGVSPFDMSAELDATHAGTISRLSEGFDRNALLVLHGFASRTTAYVDRDAIVGEFADCVLAVFRKANHVAVHLLDGSGEFKPAMQRSRSGDTGARPVSRTIRDRVLQQGKAVAFGAEATVDLSESLHDASVVSGLCAPLWDGRRVIGLVQVDCRGSFRATFGQSDLEALAVFAHQAALALANARLHEDLRSSIEHSIQGLVNALEAKDPYTAGHSEAVADLCRRACTSLGVPAEEAQAVERAALLHDIGKMGIPYHILNKRDALTPDEFRVLRSHPEVGARILQPYDFLGGLVPIVLHHHERWDGRGYPGGLAGEAIPLGARILAVVDTWHVLTSNRPYRFGMEAAMAAEELRNCAGSQFDPAIVEAFVRLVRPAKVDEEQLARV